MPTLRLVPIAASLAVLLAAALLARLAPVPGHAPTRELWFYEGVNLADASRMPQIEALWRRAAAAGYTHVLLSDARFARPRELNADDVARAKRLRALADSLRLEIVPAVCFTGRGNSAILADDPNLAEAVPVRNVALEVRGGLARVVADPPVSLAAAPPRVDAGVRLENGDAVIPADSHTRIAFPIDVAPWRTYHVSVRLRAEGFRGEPRIRVTGDGREMAYARVPPPAGDSAETRDVVFHSLDQHAVTVSFSVARGGTGTLHWSGWRIEETGPLNLVRRPGLPFAIAGLTEGRDFEPVRDSLLGAAGGRGRFEAWHAPAAIRVHRPDGTRLRASWWEAPVLFHGQVACCLSDTAVRARQRDEIARVRAWFGTRTVMLQHDEIRVLGWDPPCDDGRGAGRVLADDVRACRAAAAGTRVCVWNDMFDPLHNAVRDYYLVHGDLAGAWDGLDSSVVVVNWNGEHLEESLRFFANRGHAQVYAGYYDGDVEALRAVLPKLDAVRGVTGIMYTTWQDRWDDLERFAAIARGR